MRRLTLFFSASAALVAGGWTAVQHWPLALESGSLADDQSNRAEQQATQPVPPPASDAGRGDRLIQQALATLERRINVYAKVRQQTSVGGKVLRGSGNYWQQGAGNQRKTRWEMKTLVAGETASFVQVFDARYLWTDRQLPSRRDVTRLDMVRLRQDLVELDQAQRQGASTAGQGRAELSAAVRRHEALARGGLSALLAEMIESFEFDEPVAVDLENVSALALVGHWKQLSFKKLSPHAANGAWPEQLPHHVLLVLGQADLFPYVVEYRRGADASLARAGAKYQPVVDPLTRYEVFEVQFAAAMDSKLFRYTPSEGGYRDETNGVFQRLRTEPKSNGPTAIEIAQRR